MRNYSIPGISAKLVDYQISADPILTPGDIVVILCDLPDELTIADPDKTGEFLVVPVPANVPILINHASQLKDLITGENLKNGVLNSVGKDQHLAIVNILPLLKTDKPVALCKMIRRNGERPDVTINKELYEAMDFAYEHLGNYPAGSIVNAEIGFEDEVIEKNLELISEHTTYNSSLVYITATSEKPSDSFQLKKEIKNGQVELTLIENSKEYKKNISLSLRKDNAVVSKLNQLKELAAEAILNEITIPCPEELKDILENLEENFTLANNESGKIVNGSFTETKVIFITPDNKFEVTLKVNPILFGNIQDQDVFGFEKYEEIKIEDFYALDAETPVFNNIGNLPAYNSGLLVQAKTREYIPEEHFFSKSSVVQKQLDRSFVTCEKLILETDVRIKDKVLISIDKTTNSFTSSVLLTLEDLKEIEGITYLVINGEDIEIDKPVVSSEILESDLVIDYKGLIEIKLLAGLELDFKKFNYEISILPLGAAFDKRTVQFCHQLTTDLNECIAYFGTKPPKTTNAKDIEEQVARLSNLCANRSYADTDLDKGLYLNVITGAHKSGGYGGITNFPQTIIKSVNGEKVTIDSSLGLNIGDKIEISTVVKAKTIIDSYVVENIVDTLNAQEIHLNKVVDSKILASKTTKTFSLVNKKDVKGTYLAAMYACFANSYDIDKAPMNVVLPGESEVFYTNKQLERLLDARITPVNREPFNTNGTIVDTPTMALSTSDFTDQGTVGVIFYLIRQLRLISKPKIGKRFGDAAKQMLLQEELEAPFKTLLGDKILDYKLEIDFSKLNKQNKLDVAFSVKEAKKMKTVAITAKMY